MKGPGLRLLIPFIDRMQKVDLRTVTMEVPAQDVITRDNVPARVTAVTYFHVVDPNNSVVEIENVLTATSQIAQTTLRSVLGETELDELLIALDKLAKIGREATAAEMTSRISSPRALRVCNASPPR